MEQYQIRVQDEKIELDEKIDQLGAFLSTDIFDALPKEEKCDMRQQLGIMHEYSNILGRRISRF